MKEQILQETKFSRQIFYRSQKSTGIISPK